MNVPQRTPRFCSTVCAVRWPKGATAVAGMRPARRRCPAASPRPCSRSSRWIPPTPTGPRSCAPPRRGCRQLALADPHVVPLLVTRPQAIPLALRPLGTLRPLEDIPALLTRAGFSRPGALHIYRALPGFLHRHILNSRNSPATPARPTTCSASACTGCRSARSPRYAASPASWPATTAPPNPNADPASSWPGSQRH
jgi:hypothetical protein